MKVIKLRRGLLETMPSLHEAELVYAVDTNELYIGSAEGNKTLNYDGGTITDTTRGCFIPRHGKLNEITKLTPGELLYLEDQQSIAIAVNEKQCIVLNKKNADRIKELTNEIKELQESKRDKNDLIVSNEIETDQILLQHLSPDLRKIIMGTESDPIEIIIAANSIENVMLQDGAVSYNKLDEDMQARIDYDFGAF